jgi:gamma-glutamylcyclotransferase (GGCT)/AIG2-like uncharacterized protein YtfP
MSTGANFHLFVYGSLRSGFQSPAYEYISRYFNFIGAAKVKGMLFDMGEYPAAIPVAADAYIAGELYVIKNENEFSWAIAQVDDYEGVLSEAHETPLYRREIAEIFINGGILPAWIYWYNGDTSGGEPIASGDILEYLKSKGH